MKKIIFTITCLLLINNIASAEFDPKYNPEVKLDINSIQTQEYQQARKEAEERQKYQQDMQEQGQDYMYRMQQQMMQVPNWNPFGGYRY